jgi:hypothetical protein
MNTVLLTACTVLALSSVAAVAQTPSPNSSGQTLFTPQGPVYATGPATGYQTAILPGGGGDGVLINNGNGTSTLFNPDGAISTVPSAR